MLVELSKSSVDEVCSYIRALNCEELGRKLEVLENNKQCHKEVMNKWLETGNFSKLYSCLFIMPWH